MHEEEESALVECADCGDSVDPDLDRSVVQREQCLYCEHYLTNGPRTEG